MSNKHDGMPGWVKVLLAGALVLVVAMAISKLAGVDHGPGMHGGSEVPSHASPAAGTGHVPPVQHAP